jgi:hypothetical protein
VQIIVIIIVIVIIIAEFVVIVMRSLMEYQLVFEDLLNFLKESNLNPLFHLKIEFRLKKQEKGDYANPTYLRILYLRLISLEFHKLLYPLYHG